MGRALTPTLLAVALAVSSCGQTRLASPGTSPEASAAPPPNGSATAGNDATVPSAELPSPPQPPPIAEQIVAALEPLQHGGWMGWKQGTRVTVESSTRSELDGVHSWNHPDLTYVVEEADRRLVRLQQVNGSVARQEFPIDDRSPLPTEPARGNGEAARLTIDGASVDCLHAEEWFEWIGENDGGSTTTHRWFLAAHPTILLRREVGGEWWAVTSIRAKCRAAEQDLECVEITRRIVPSNGPVVIRTLLSGKVPGFRVEEFQACFRSDATPGEDQPWMTQHERVSRIEIP